MQSPLTVPTVKDRVVQTAVRLVVEPICEADLQPEQYAYRAERNALDAIGQVHQLVNTGHREVIDADLSGDFDNLPHGVIMEGVAAEVADGNILRLIEKFLRAGVMENGVFKPTTVGTPQGGLISPLLANIALNHLDWQLEAAGFRFVRYADDFVVLCRTESRAQEARQFVEQFLRDKLGLSLSPEKTVVTHTTKGFSFLGFTIARSVSIRVKSLRKFKEKVRALTCRHYNLEAELLKKLNAVIRGTTRYFATRFARCRKQLEGLDEWIRMRLRCMKYGRKSREDNRRLSCRTLARWGLISMYAMAQVV